MQKMSWAADGEMHGVASKNSVSVNGTFYIKFGLEYDFGDTCTATG